MILGGVAIALTGFAAGLAVAQAVPQTGRTPQFENADVKVWRSVIAPNSPLPLHRHEHPRVLVALTGGTMAIVEEDGTEDVQVWESGNAYWLPANKPGSLHQDVNVGDKPIVVVVAELKGVS
jgi:quercetin dioxygenase-like cupin family protein